MSTSKRDDNQQSSVNHFAIVKLAAETTENSKMFTIFRQFVIRDSRRMREKFSLRKYFCLSSTLAQLMASRVPKKTRRVVSISFDSEYFSLVNSSSSRCHRK